MANREQAAVWNESSGPTWVELQQVLDRLFAPIEAILVEEGAPSEGARVLDIGCGAGATTLAMARRLGPSARCTGVDISAPLVAAATARAAREGIAATFIHADAQTHAFEPAAFDAVISRFGVMFFDDPEAAFANIRRAVRRDGKLTFVAWRSPEENPFMTTAARAVAPLLPDVTVPTSPATGPGQFAFADGERVRRILDASGFRDVAVRSLDVPTVLDEKDLLSFVTKLGPVGRALRTASDEQRARVAEVLRGAFAAYVHDGAVRFDAACWLVSARA